MYNSTGVVFYNKNAYLSPEHKPIEENQNDKTVLQNDEKDLGDLAQQQQQQQQQQDCSSEHSRQTSDDNY